MDNFAARLQMNRERLSVKELQLAAFLQAHQQRASSLTISALSTAAGVSTATVSRFAKNLGYVNYAGLRVALGQAPVNGASLFEEIDPGESPLAMADKVFAANINALQATVNSLDATSLATAVDLLLGARFIDLYGLGGSNIVALDGYHKFLRTPLEVRYAADYHMQLMAATRLTKRDVAVLISTPGRTRTPWRWRRFATTAAPSSSSSRAAPIPPWPSSPTSCWSVLRRKRLTAPRPCTR